MYAPPASGQSASTRRGPQEPRQHLGRPLPRVNEDTPYTAPPPYDGPYAPGPGHPHYNGFNVVEVPPPALAGYYPPQYHPHQFLSARAGPAAPHQKSHYPTRTTATAGVGTASAAQQQKRRRSESDDTTNYSAGEGGASASSREDLLEEDGSTARSPDSEGSSSGTPTETESSFQGSGSSSAEEAQGPGLANLIYDHVPVPWDFLGVGKKTADVADSLLNPVMLGVCEKARTVLPRVERFFGAGPSRKKNSTRGRNMKKGSRRAPQGRTKSLERRMTEGELQSSMLSQLAGEPEGEPIDAILPTPRGELTRPWHCSAELTPAQQALQTSLSNERALQAQEDGDECARPLMTKKEMFKAQMADQLDGYQPLFARMGKSWDFPLAKTDTNDRLVLKFGFENDEIKEVNRVLTERAGITDWRLSAASGSGSSSRGGGPGRIGNSLEWS
mmetsp:Transcript_27883/g.70496  ORF Transcript_27883/g.70496 Transcript_27883/m.70496 type:complete len:445 (-) Transcript_27883:1479-2813(-)|eukprot:CAMPEP_0178993580 /NCGR_PEP_ID=MMETSP0795-20121207/6782_1 /TAXON_ID=88552 /ORGANISM="Amoebophrya sp., Strain Ameob2" /LENGTH=444 /DNA_ID=CAMNT_0020685655 /DNA_START=100 /DNA_END=1434 /DNA_ORIENTATION=-